MLSRTIEHDSSLRAARMAALVLPALLAPAVVILAVTAMLRGDYNLLIAAAVGLAGAAVAGAGTGAVVFGLRLGQRAGFVASVSWALALGVPAAAIAAVLSYTASSWVRSAALRDALTVNDVWPMALAIAAVSSAILLGARIRGDREQPVVVRHRHRVYTEHTFFAAAAVVWVAIAALSSTRPPRFASSDPDELRTQLPLLEREAARYPNHFRSQYLFGNALTHTHECARAIDPLRRAVAIRPRDGWAENDLAFALSCSRHFAEARAPYEQAVKLLPDEELVQNGYAYTLEQLRDKSAERTYHAILRRFPYDAYAAAREATLRFNRGERDEGLDEMRLALTLGDSSFGVLLSAAELFANAALLKDAAAQYRLIAQRQPRDLWIWAQYASTAYLAGSLEEARNAFVHAESINAHAIETVDSWRMMRDAAQKGVPPSALPPIPPTRPFTAVSSYPR